MRQRNRSNNGHLPAIPEESVSDLMTRDPALYERIVDHLEKDGFSPNAVAVLCNVRPDTVRRIRSLLGPTATHAALRNVTGHLLEAVQAIASRLAKEADTLPSGQLAQALGILTDRITLLIGEPSQRIEVAHVKTPSPEELRKLFDKLPRAEAREITPPANGTNPPTARAPWAPQP